MGIEVEQPFPSGHDPPRGLGSSLPLSTESSGAKNAVLSALRFRLLILTSIRLAAQLGGPPGTSQRSAEVEPRKPISHSANSTRPWHRRRQKRYESPKPKLTNLSPHFSRMMRTALSPVQWDGAILRTPRRSSSATILRISSSLVDLR